MQDLEEPAVQNFKSYNIYVMGNKLFLFDNSIKYETYKNEWYYGIIFILEGKGYHCGLNALDARYDVVHHYHMDWERLNISDEKGWKDIPFHSGTYSMLPEQVKVLEL